MIGSSKNNRENYPRKYFWTQEKETRVKFNPWLSANRPSNNWALVQNTKTSGGSYTGRLRGLTAYHLDTIFEGNTPFVYLSLTNGIPFTYLV